VRDLPGGRHRVRGAAVRGGGLRSALLGVQLALLLPRLVLLLRAGRRQTADPRWSHSNFRVAGVMALFALVPPVALLVVCRAYPGPGMGQFAPLAAAVWIVAGLAAAGRSGSARWLSPICTAAGVLALLLCLEAVVRGTDELDRRLDAGFRSEILTWPLEKTTAVFGIPSVQMDGSAWLVKPKNTRRAICLGSSSTQGYGASGDGTTYPAVLEQRLRTRHGEQVEVINAGLGGAPLFMLAVYLEDVLLEMDPDVVVLYYGFNGESLWAQELHRRILEEKENAPHLDSEEKMWAALQLRWNPPWLVDAFLTCTRSRLVMALVLATEWLQHRGDADPDRSSRYVEPELIAETTAKIIDDVHMNDEGYAFLASLVDAALDGLGLPEAPRHNPPSSPPQSDQVQSTSPISSLTTMTPEG